MSAAVDIDAPITITPSSGDKGGEKRSDKPSKPVAKAASATPAIDVFTPPFRVLPTAGGGGRGSGGAAGHSDGAWSQPASYVRW